MGHVVAFELFSGIGHGNFNDFSEATYGVTGVTTRAPVIEGSVLNIENPRLHNGDSKEQKGPRPGLNLPFRKVPVDCE
jgi:hypothetical protein